MALAGKPDAFDGVAGVDIRVAVAGVSGLSEERGRRQDLKQSKPHAGQL
jgi:hypothetical protein